MTLDELIDKVASEPPRTVTFATNVLAPGRLPEAQRKGGLLLTDLLSGASHGEPRTLRYGHVIGSPASGEAFHAWQERFPHHPLPEDLRALVGRANGIHLWADLATGRGSNGIAPLEEWDLARVKMYGPEADPGLLPDRYLAISYHTDGAAFIVLDVDWGRYFLTDSSGPDETCPIGISASDLLDWVWNHRSAPTTTPTPHARLERFTKTTHTVEVLGQPTSQYLDRVIRSMHDDWSTTLELTCGEHTMMISANDGRYSVLVSADGEFFDLVGESGASGDVVFVHGGQPAEHPARHLVTRDLAARAMEAFVHEHRMPTSSTLVWEKQ